MLRRVALAALTAAALAAAPAGAAGFAPLDQPGPPLAPSAAELAGSVRCTDGVRDAAREPVLLLPATTVTSEQNFSFSTQRSLTAAGIPWCTSDQPGRLASNMDDLQVRAQYVTYAIRHVHALAGRKIAVAGHSQGGGIMRAALRFWPDTRAMVEDVVGIAGTNHGSEAIAGQCALAGCSAAFHQQAAGSRWMAAVNSGQETFAGISYTQVASDNDQVVTPAGRDGVSAVSGPGRITNVAIQDVCPGAPYEHLTVIGAPVTWELLRDAVTHDGPADPARIDRATCGQVVPPGAEPAELAAGTATSVAALGAAIATYPQVPREPDPACWTTATCTGAAAPALQVRVVGRPRVRAGRRTTVRVEVRSPQGDALAPVPGAVVGVAGRRVRTGAAGRARVTLRVRRAGRVRVRASRPGTRPATTSLRVARR